MFWIDSGTQIRLHISLGFTIVMLACICLGSNDQVLVGVIGCGVMQRSHRTWKSLACNLPSPTTAFMRCGFERYPMQLAMAAASLPSGYEALAPFVQLCCTAQQYSIVLGQ
jgi:hypothetical protein